MAGAFQIRALKKASRILGSPERLCGLLDAPHAAFYRWMEGEESMPVAYFGLVLDFLADMEKGATLVGSGESTGIRLP
ncbi:MAG TPA: hypothetical protein VNU64_25275 [Burkholderiales bacterium]|nr:hypothetical protein [Burkholderiales bacterium]